MERSPYDHFLDAVVIIDENQRPVYFNAAAGRLLGLTPRLLRTGKTYSELIKLENAELIHTGNDWVPYQETRFEGPGGRSGVVRAAVFREDGDSSRRVVVHRDTTEEVSLVGKYRAELREKERLIVELKETRDWLIQSGKLTLLGQFVAELLHDLATPVATLRASARQARQKWDEGSFQDADQAVFLELVEAGSDRLYGLTRRLKSFLASPVDEADFREHSLKEIVDNAIRLVGNTGAVSVRNSVREGMKPLSVDSPMIEQMAVNLVKNATEALREAGTSRPKVIVSAEEAADGVLIRFEDNGPGLPAEVERRLFTPFVTTKAGGKGTGLGLTICRKIAEKHGGGIQVSSGRDGACFTVFLPWRNDQPGGTLSAWKGRNVLVVDDDKGVRDLVSEVLIAELGAKVAAADDGYQAIEMLRNERFDILLTDLRMPGIGGMVLAARAREIRPDMPAVLMSPVDATEIPGFDKTLFNHVLKKPFDGSELVRALSARVSFLL